MVILLLDEAHDGMYYRDGKPLDSGITAGIGSDLIWRYCSSLWQWLMGEFGS